MMIKTALYSFLALATLIGCNKNELPKPSDTDEWIIPANEVFDGGPGKDGIPALTDPEFVSVADATFMADDELVVGYVSGGEVKAYPHLILDRHEIVNDDVDGRKIAIIYCPLTGTGLGWDRVVNGQETTFGVSGLLYNSNIIPYDRSTESNWSQIRLDCVNGDWAGTQAGTFHIVETTWKTWTQMYPNTVVVSTNTGHNRDYGRYPYADYKSDEGLFFPVAHEDDRLHYKERVHGIIRGEEVTVYRFETLGDSTTAIEDEVGGEDVVVVGNLDANIFVSFKRQLSNGKTLSFSAVQDELPIILEDTEGNRWDVFGYALSGPRKGQRLSRTVSFMGYWFSWVAFYPEVEIYE